MFLPRKENLLHVSIKSRCLETLGDPSLPESSFETKSPYQDSTASQSVLFLDIEFGIPMAETIAYKPIQFFTLTFVVTWVCWFAAPYLGDPETGDAIFVILS